MAWKSAAMMATAAALAASGVARGEFTRNIMITGYWPPTNEMLRPFSQNSSQNPGGWQGLNWEGRGYNIYSYFPEFPGGVNQNPRGTGDFQVDYQAASADFWRITGELKPCAIITFSRGDPGSNWELESRARKLPLNQWSPDYLAPTQPTPDLPIASEPDGMIRYSSLPMSDIRTAVQAAIPGFNAFIDTSNNFGGTFVSEFTSYHGAWYQNLHSSPNDPAQCFAGGHIHVGINTPLATAQIATFATLRTLEGYLDSVIPVPSPSVGAVLAAGAMLAGRGRRARG
ncbi:MAG: hypothetical protein GC200_08470 [Tepidisphaera sp.]|nr:hypothetical protein [Tepidisphaera sp.]